MYDKKTASGFRHSSVHFFLLIRTLYSGYFSVVGMALFFPLAYRCGVKQLMDLLAVDYNGESDDHNESSYRASNYEIILRCFLKMGGWSHCETFFRGSVRESNSYCNYGRVQKLLQLYTRFTDNSKQCVLAQGRTGVVSHTWRELDINREVHLQVIIILFWKS